MSRNSFKTVFRVIGFTGVGSQTIYHRRKKYEHHFYKADWEELDGLIEAV